MKPVHAVVAGLFALFWIGLLAFVLTHGKDEGSGVDVYSELPPGFTAALQTKGVTYAGLSPVDSATVQQVLSHATRRRGGGRGRRPDRAAYGVQRHRPGLRPARTGRR